MSRDPYASEHESREDIEREFEAYNLACRITDSLLSGEDDELFVRQVAYLLGLRPAFAVAALEETSRVRLQLIRVESWNLLLRMVPTTLKPALEAVWARFEFGPRHDHGIPTEDVDLLNARDYVMDRIVERLEAEHRAEVQARLERRRGSRGR